MPDVFIRPASYDYPALRRTVFELLEKAVLQKVEKGCRVLIKPNLLAPSPPERAIVTHPLVVRAVVEYVLDCGGLPCVSDSPPLSSFSRIVRETGLKAVLSGLDVECREFSASVVVHADKPFQSLELAVEALEADFVVNLPKLKSHSQMLLTLGVKNLFGCVVGMRKPEWHFRAGVDRELFARLLVTVCRAVNPAVTLLDGVLALEGEGPGSGGVPREIGLLIASPDPVAVDRAVCSLLGIPDDRLLTNRAAMAMGYAGDAPSIIGDFPMVEDFRFPEMVPLVFGPQRLEGFLRRHLVQRPRCQEKLCRLCGECRRICPAKAIALGAKSIRVDYDRCIRCYCCIEVCPHAALRPEESLAGKAVRKILR